jgi:hypothetical protein
MTEAYDVVLNALQTKHDELMAVTMSNMNSENFALGIMNDIRLEQCELLKEAIEVWEAHKRGDTI